MERKSRLRFERIDSPLFHSSILALWSGRLSRLYPRVDLSDPFTLSFIMVAEKAVRLSKEEHSPRSIQSKIGDRFVFDPRSRGLSSRCKVKCVRTCGRTTLRRRRERERRRHRNIILEREPRGQRERERYRFNRYTRLSLYDTSALKGWCISACRCSK